LTANDRDAPAASGGYGRGHRALEIASIVFAFGALTWVGLRAIRALEGPRTLLFTALSVLTGYVVADFLSGVVHWAGDTLGNEQTPIFGPNFVRPFRLHHVDPKDITRHDFIETNGNSCIAASPILLALVLFMPATTGAFFYICVGAASAALFVFCTNEFHKWAHADQPPALALLLQRWHLILSPEHHAIHHAAPQVRAYCITVGWVNPLLDRTRFFRHCEKAVDYLMVLLGRASEGVSAGGPAQTAQYRAAPPSTTPPSEVGRER
jgi:ubiquitin-conjugating enzyme E2 variant